MSSAYKRFLGRLLEDVRYQYGHPQRSIAGWLFTHYWTRRSRPAVYGTINHMNIRPNDNVLEIGYGRGDGLKRVLELIQTGQGSVFGLELSRYMSDVTSSRLIDSLKATSVSGRVLLEDANEFYLLQYPDRFFDAIYHVDTFYFWPESRMHQILSEICRTLKPGCSLFCGMELNRLKTFEKWQVLNPAEIDPMRYMQWLEPAGFVDVKMRYLQVDSQGNTFPDPSSTTREIQVISARRPDAGEKEEDAEEQLRRLELEIKRSMLFDELAKSQKARPQADSEKLHDIVE